MFDGGEVLDGAQLGDEFLEVFVCELHPVIGDSHLGNTEPSKNFSLVETENVLCGYFG